MLLLIYLICPIICAIVAGSKHRSAVGWFILGLLLPVISVIIILALGDARPAPIIVHHQAAAPAPPRRKEKSCPECGEDVLAAAKVCKHCGYRFDRPAKQLRLEARRTPDITASGATRRQAAVVCLKILAEAGRGFDQTASDAILGYLEAESGDAEYSRREAGKVIDWMRALPSDELTVRSALQNLAASVDRLDAFKAAGAAIIGPDATSRQEKLAEHFQRAFSSAGV